jgi:hypothetical protein
MPFQFLQETAFEFQAAFPCQNPKWPFHQPQRESYLLTEDTLNILRRKGKWQTAADQMECWDKSERGEVNNRAVCLKRGK